MQMRDRISDFLEEKQGLSANSKQSYKYDLEQFLDVCGRTDFWDQSQDLPSPASQPKNQRPEAKTFGL